MTGGERVQGYLWGLGFVLLGTMLVWGWKAALLAFGWVLLIVGAIALLFAMFGD